MSFFSNTIGVTLAIALFSGCGSPSEPPQGPENTISDQTVEAASSSEPTPQIAAPAAVEPAPAAPVEVDPSAQFASLPTPYSDADYARGRRVFRQCSSCHTVKEGAAALVGPNLYGIFDRKVGEAEGFPYSTAISSLEGDAKFDWTPEKLDAWLTSPRAFLPGNRMSFAGVRREDDRTSVIAYLMLESGWSEE